MIKSAMSITMPSEERKIPTCGILYVVATPIGNLEDITMRALRILQEVDCIACEDTRHTRKLLTHFQIRAKLVSYYKGKEAGKSTEIVTRLLAGADVALVSDAGVPCISDPGYTLVQKVLNMGFGYALCRGRLP